MKKDSGIDAKLVYVGTMDQLAEVTCLRVNVLFRGAVDSVLVVHYQGEVRAYRNLCVHMPRALDCEGSQVFDQAQGYLRCSMHGIVYSPEDGESLSDICRGKKLTAVRVREIEQHIYLDDRRVKAVP